LMSSILRVLKLEVKCGSPTRFLKVLQSELHGRTNITALLFSN
jgi:hypothetical protein